MDAVEKRPFGFWTAVAFVIGGVIGAGIYVVPGSFAAYGWNGALAWVAGGVGALIIGAVLSALTASRPQSPGLVAVIGQDLGPIAGVLVGWGAWVSYWCSNAYIALTSARYAGQIVPALAATPFRQAMTATLLMVALTVLNLTGLKSSGRFQVVTTALKLLPLFAVVLIACLMIAGGHATATAATHVPVTFSPLLSATALAMVAIIGFESASIAAERIRDPERNVARATMTGIALSCVLYLIVCTAITFTVPAAQLSASNAPVALFIEQHWGRWAGDFVAAFAVISTVGCLNVWVLLQSEIPLGLARAGQLPGWFGRTNSKDIAVLPLMLGSALTCVLLLAGSWHSGASLMDFMLRLTAASGLWIYAFAGAAAIKARIRPVLALLALVFALAMVVGSGTEAALLSIALMALALPLYVMTRRGALAEQPAE
ncbi:MAG: APC family permease [Sphingomonas sp.]|uniref:APC family permease n=1 Tax=Sphingomonas sp. TaxID=28214 RepID=UPI00120A94B0|nr:APC family permease [Sphingomonas sp.]THD37996.1 MAG: APC family permease [Sphingomonas sp.]